jgi:hypothetical protein
MLLNRTGGVVWALKPPSAIRGKWEKVGPWKSRVFWALEIESFLGPVKWHRADRRVPFGAQKALHAHRAVQITGT